MTKAITRQTKHRKLIYRRRNCGLGDSVNHKEP